VPEGKLPLYFGGGARILFKRHEDDRFGLRAPVGLAYMFDNVPVDIFAELAPTLDLAPGTRFSVYGGIGARYYFK